jgi:predicted O-linked N-acetylglucosamine transferase (SPINDLY family)
MPTAVDHSSGASVKEAVGNLIDEGNALEDTGNVQTALDRYDAAVRLNPESARAHLNRGNALLAMNRPAEAKEAYVTALRHQPEYAAADYNLGNACARLGEHEEALYAYRRALMLKPDFADAEVAAGALYEDLDRHEEAADSYRRALQIAPDYAAVHVSLGDVSLYLGRFEEAIGSYGRALEAGAEVFTASNKAQIHNKLGCTLLAIGRLPEATSSFRAAIEAAPGFPDAHINLGRALVQLNDEQAAIDCFQRAIGLDPANAVAHHLLGNSRMDRRQFHEALTCYRRTIEINPNDAYAHYSEGNALTMLSETDEAVASYTRALEIKPDLADARSNLLFVHNYRADRDPEELLAEARNFGDVVAASAMRFRSWNNVPVPEKVLRIGIVSGDFREHPVSYFLHSILEVLKNEYSHKVEIYAYSNRVARDAMTDRIQALCRGWCVVATMSDEDLARQIHEERIDILVDLSGHSGNNRLPMFAWKPAPLQVAWLGYFATTGVEAIDYLIADEWTLPPSEEVHFTERIWRLPETRLCYSPPGPALPVGLLPALANGYVTFGSFNNLAKMNDPVVALWSKVLTVVPGSRLMLKSISLHEPSVRERTIARFGAHGIGKDRLMLEGASPRNDYLAGYRRLDIALDSFPYTGGATTADGLWMGVPALTIAGKSFLARQGVGLLMNAGLSDWIAGDADEYVALAAKHAADLLRLAALRQKLRQQVQESPVFDARRFAVNFESALRGMWTQWCDEQEAV